MSADHDPQTFKVFIGACERCGTCATLLPRFIDKEITYCCLPCVNELEAA